jgi:flagellar basal-body rod protein FlgF
MSVGLHRSAIAMVGLERELDGISTNLANLGTVGFKRGRSAFHEFSVPRQTGDVRGVAIRTDVDFSQGDLERTGRDLDFALLGDGFFAVEGAAGEVYTRVGEFHLTPEGVLVTADGLPVNWRSKPTAIDVAGERLTVESDGTVRQGSAELGRLRIVDFADRQRLRRDGQGHWVAPADLRQSTATAAVHQYALETSNGNGIEEMVAMIGVQRAFESVARVVSSIEESYRRLTRPF